MNASSSLEGVNALATNTAMSVWNIGGDFVIVIVLLALFFVFAWYVGRGPFVAILFALYAAYATYIVFPYMSYLPSAPASSSVLAHIGLYAALTLIFYIILRRVVVSDFLYIAVLGLVVLALLAAGFVIALAYHTFDVTSIYQFTPAIDALFAPKEYFFWWFAGPAIGLFFLAR